MRWQFTFVVCLGVAAGLAGCSRRPATAEVSGTVTINGRPVTAGSVLFLSADDRQSASADLSPQGTYKIPAAPVGPVKVAVQTGAFRRGTAQPARPGSAPPPGMQGSMPGYRPVGVDPVGTTYVPIPPKYESPSTSGLTFTVQKGPQKIDIPLQPQ